MVAGRGWMRKVGWIACGHMESLIVDNVEMMKELNQTGG